MREFVVVIPARYSSTRLPGKPLALIAGEPMIRHVHRVATRSAASEVWIATDDARIERVARDFGAKVCMTRTDHRSGTERLAELCELKGWADERVVVNLQGDEPLMPPELIDQCAALVDSDSIGMATLASGLFADKDYEDPNVAKVVTDANGNALYFSRAPIPFSRDASTRQQALKAALRHHGIYAYRCGVLRRLVAAEPCTMEECEKLEQLRALWLKIDIRVGIATVRPGPGVDTEADIAAVEALMKGAS